MIQESLFGSPKIQIETEGIKYAGSKLKLIPDILGMLGNIQCETVWDAFSGTTRVSQALAKTGYRVISSDRAIWSEVFGRCYLENDRDKNEYRELIAHLNYLSPIEGWFTENYGSELSFSEGGQKRPWQKKNTMKLDAIREEIDRLCLDELQRSVALTSLILALDKVDNTLGHYVSYLKSWSPRSYNDLWLSVPNYEPQPKGRHRVFHGDVFDLIPEIHTDAVYFDPPYGSNNEKMPPSRVRYASYYHVWTTICLNDKPDLFGKANRRQDCSDNLCGSVFEEYRKDDQGRFIAVEAIRRLINDVDAHWVLLSYSTGGRATASELLDVLSSCGTIVKIREIDYKKNVMADMRWTNEWLKSAEEPNKELLFLLEKSV